MATVVDSVCTAAGSSHYHFLRRSQPNTLFLRDVDGARAAGCDFSIFRNRAGYVGRPFLGKQARLPDFGRALELAQTSVLLRWVAV
jgi:hypothetical protein